MINLMFIIISYIVQISGFEEAMIIYYISYTVYTHIHLIT